MTCNPGCELKKSTNLEEISEEQGKSKKSVKIRCPRKQRKRRKKKKEEEE